MWPYEILIGFKQTMRICAHGIIRKGDLRIHLNSRGLNSCSFPDIITGKKLLFHYSHYEKVNNTKRFHIYLSNSNQTSPNDSKETGFNNISKLVNDDPFNDIVNSITSKTKRSIDDTGKDFINNKYMTDVPEPVKKWLASSIEKCPQKEIEKKFPESKTFLHNIYAIVTNEIQTPGVLSLSFQPVKVKKSRLWSCTYDIKWPQPLSFKSIGHSKASTSTSAALKILYWLHLNNKIKNRLPVVYGNRERISLLNAPEELKIDKKIIDKIEDFLENHEKDIENIVSSIHDKEVYQSVSEDVLKEKQHPISHIKTNTDMRNKDLLGRLSIRKNISNLDLPIFQYRKQILEVLEKSQALVIKGDTGCGKTTQVPQFILDYMTEKGIGSKCSMVVTQPRRISAISLAQRIAFERGEKVGDVVGYQVRLQQILPKQHGSILFCTTGILLKKLQSNLGLDGCSHVIIDEAHERSVDTDMLLVLVKRAIQKNPSLKLIIMSATINADLFQNYLKCNAIEVPGRLYPVTMNFLEDVRKLGISPQKVNNITQPFVDCDHIADLIRWICENKPPGAILCFLPGWGHIQRIQTTLQDYLDPKQIIIPLHSRVPYFTQNKIFDSVPEGYRKIILATDIAETGITVPDVVYVIDSACHKEVRWHENKGLSSINTHWISKANLNQRKGRAGRVREGESYHFITKKQYEELDPYPVPEVLRVSLEKTVLDCKTYSNEKVEDFLINMPQAPRLTAVKKAIKDLETLGALDENQNLTHLGKRIALFSIHPKLSKAMVYGAIFQCLNPITTISAVLSMDSEIFHGILDNKSYLREVKKRFHPSSDHLAIAWIYAQWQSYFNKGPQAAFQFCKQNNVNSDRINILHRIRNLNLEHLRESGLIQDIRVASTLESKENEFAVLDELVRGILLSGMDQILKHRNFEFRKGRLSKSGSSMIMEDDAKAQLTPECVNYKRTFWPSQYLVYYQKTHHDERRTTLIRESSMISPVTALLFSQGHVVGSMYKDDKFDEKRVMLHVSGKKNLNLVCDEQTARTLLRFRDLMWSIVRFYVINNADSNDASLYDSFYKDLNESENLNVSKDIDSYKQKMLNILAHLLSSTSNSIDIVSNEEDSEPSDKNRTDSFR